MTVITELVADGSITNPESAKGKLIQCAARLFNTKGFDRTTVRDIAREVGILSGSIFHHFPNKEAILCGVMREAVLIATSKMRAALALADTPEARLQALIHCELESIHGLNGDGFALLVNEWRSLGPDNQAEVLALRDVYEQLWLDVLDQVRAAGLIDMDTFLVRRFLVGALSNTYTWFHLDGDMTLQQLAHQALKLIVRPDQ
ncbi:TetR/AcrR family transcriptional regulator [Exilibacterium tricleocarpae]|uniref:TetR/AcrR family transcriptional regulator n=1 Tax=Exilibacterium tricleocarpae TaxID=2591008 RepID=A0A545TZ30_9GAMM|nr:TetR/AcrR family transcriptional regulator [Exilibacterium tricleocarpae]TQV82443.1 TetR/AcrR family transcriptional regulator [Exilibacterium tricleocarpae]